MNIQNPEYLNKIASAQLAFNNYNNNSNRNNSEAMYSNYQQQQQVSAIQMELDEQEIWQQFYSVTNEMILTKAGR